MGNLCKAVEESLQADDPRPATLVAEVKDEIARRHTREFLQALEARKLEADESELALLRLLESYLTYKLDEDAVPTDSHDPWWYEARRSEGDYDRG